MSLVLAISKFVSVFCFSFLINFSLIFFLSFFLDPCPLHFLSFFLLGSTCPNGPCLRFTSKNYWAKGEYNKSLNKKEYTKSHNTKKNETNIRTHLKMDHCICCKSDQHCKQNSPNAVYLGLSFK